MMKISIVIVLVVAALVVAYLMLDKRPGYGAWYGIAKLTGARLDIGPVDFATLHRHPSANDALVCPAGLCANAEPDQQAKAYDMTPTRLLERLTRIALAEPDTTALDCGPYCDRTARFLQLSRIMRFPDTIDIAVLAVGTDKSTLAIYSRSLVGRRDFGVNRARVNRWLAALESPAG
jgi:uncharacterized protein (DUF1499 family)